MISALLITNSDGFPLYDRNLTKFQNFKPALLSGLISSISHIGRSIFHENLGTVKFGNDFDPSFISIITKEIPQTKQIIHFVFFMEGTCEIVYIKRIATEIFIEIRQVIRAKTGPLSKLPNFQSTVDRIIKDRFYDFRAC